jgi:hypothetical protein
MRLVFLFTIGLIWALPAAAADQPSESVARQEFTKLATEHEAEVVAFKMTGGRSLGELYEVQFEMTLSYPRGLYLFCKNSSQPSCAKLGVVEPGGLVHDKGKIVLEKTENGWRAVQRP